MSMTRDDKDELLRTFVAIKKDRDRRGRVGNFFRIVLWWLILLLLIHLVLASRWTALEGSDTTPSSGPGFFERMAGPVLFFGPPTNGDLVNDLITAEDAALDASDPPSGPTDADAAAETAESPDEEPRESEDPTAALVTDEGSLMGNPSSFLSFREYLARTVGAIPPGCAVAADTTPRPSETAAPKPWFAAAGGERCAWRNDWRNFGVALSPDVGPVQKLTLLLLVAGFVMMRAHRARMMLEGVTFSDIFVQTSAGDLAVSGSQVLVGAKTSVGAAGAALKTDPNDAPSDAGPPTSLLQHPITYARYNKDLRESIPLYPERIITLSPPGGGVTETTRYEAILTRNRDLMTGRIPTGAIDLLRDVFQAAAKTGRVGPAAERMHVALFEFRDRVISALWAVEYVLWFLPTVGFLGTIYGISASLVEAKSIFSDDDDTAFGEKIASVVDKLGVAFDTTSLALACSALLYFWMRRYERSIDAVVAGAGQAISALLLDRLADPVQVEQPPRPEPVEPGGT